jgi:general secretion pathway protein G
VILAAGRPGLLRGRGCAGITYIELLVTVSVMAILATLALPTGLRIRRRAQETELELALHRIRRAIDEYHKDWELGYIESDSEHGWPETLEQLTEEIEFHGPAPGQDPSGAGAGNVPASPFTNQSNRRPSPLAPAAEVEPRPKVYLRAIPQDPFNKYDDEWDTGGWRARSYDDEPDSSSWGGDGVYDVYSAAEWLSLDGLSRYGEW